MVFSSIVFLIYFLPAFLLAYYLADKKYKNIIILVFSIFFYSWGAPKFIFVILGTTFIDFHLVKWMAAMQNNFHRRMLLTFSVSINLGLLIFFKYSNFFIENVNAFLAVSGAHQINFIKIIMPIGISFYTFETITYVVDVYRKVHKPLDKFWDYQLYIILFPKLIAGPIIPFHDLADQITDRSAHDSYDNRLTGFYRFVIGLAKKTLIANHMAVLADNTFSADFHQLTTAQAWLGITAYTFQIYFDFSGYSDMAIGIGRMIGFRFNENFNNPYISQSITEFWRRWHISLGSWMRNYLYIPLGGNKVKSRTRLYFNLWIVFLISGLWHGASWNFVIWGAYHGLFLVLERSFLLNFYQHIGRIASTVLTFLIVVTGWVFFRTDNFTDAYRFLNKMYIFNFNDFPVVEIEYQFYLVLAVFFSFFSCLPKLNKLHDIIFINPYSDRLHLIASALCVLLMMISISCITSFGFNPFIYFRF